MADHVARHPHHLGDNKGLASFSDDDLAAHHIAVVSEQEDLTARYLDDGGDPNLLPARP